MIYLVKISLNCSEHIDADIVIFNESGAVQFYENMRGDRVLVKAFASGCWQTINNETLKNKPQINLVQNA
jgi:uncharacterized NAD-dependent epimerase/dehydratase family protein